MSLLTALLLILYIVFTKEGRSTSVHAVYDQSPWTNFSFPDINGTQVLEHAGKNVGQVPPQYLSTLRKSNDSKKNAKFLAFHPVLSADDRQALLFVFQTFVRACLKFNVTFFLYGGTLIGSLRHHDMIPWDDDIDVMVNTSQKEILRKALSSVGNDFQLHFISYFSKFFWTKGHTLRHLPYTWPFIDIFFFSENSTHIFDDEPVYRNTFSYNKHHIFPFCSRPFAGTLLPVPRNATAVVNQNYSPSLCVSLAYSHKLDEVVPKTLWATIPCTELYKLYPFVFHQHIGGRVREVLLFDTTLLGTFVVSEHCG
ncbi:fukutin-related protein [Biomphalaria glabrata]|nr:fukutin-related protein [Biomphalaria glabrata]